MGRSQRVSAKHCLSAHLTYFFLKKTMSRTQRVLQNTA